MNRFFGIFRLLLLMAAIVIAPVQSSYAAAVPVKAPIMMQMEVGSPCLPKDCKSMPDCPMALSGSAGAVVLDHPTTSALVASALVSDGFAINQERTLSSLPIDGLRRPPKLSL